MEQPLEVLKRVFGYSSFRGLQQEIIGHTLDGGHSVVIMPTGSGKSLCYQLPALIRPGLTLVVSPLIALMQDQVTGLKEMGVRAACLNSSFSAEDSYLIERQAEEGELDLLYVAPERATNSRFLRLLSRLRVSLFAIDEAHCVSQWGHDFRPDYIRLPCLYEVCPGVPRMALTATADAATRKDILERLQLQNARLFLGGYDRPNIRYSIQARQDGRRQLGAFLNRRQEQSGIIYCLTRKKVENLATWLESQGFRALTYHAGMPAEERRENQTRFTHETLIMVATLAFGLGIDKPDVRFVVHTEMPKSVEAFYQETGRAGRDGLPAEALMLWGLSDLILHKSRLQESSAEESIKRIETQRLNALVGLCETSHCRRQVLLEYFGDTTGPCGNCDTCLDPVDTWDATEAARKALSAVYRTGQRFGVGYLTDLLLGKSTERHVQNFHHQLPTFGVGQDLDARTWASVFRQLVAGGYLDLDLAGHGGLQLTARSSPLLKGEESLRLRRERSSPKKASKRTKVAVEAPADDALWQSLRRCRLDLARAQGVPAYVVAHDATLAELAHHRPSSLAELENISGFGEVKRERYGQAFLDVLRAFREGEASAPAATSVT